MATVAELVRKAHAHWDEAPVLSRTGQELHDRNRLDLAREVLSRALELDAGDEDAWEHLAFAYLRGFEPDRGFETLREGIARTGSNQLRVTLAGFTPDAREREGLLAQVGKGRRAATKTAVASVRFLGGDAAAFEELWRLQAHHPRDRRVRETWLWTLWTGRQRGLEQVCDLRETAVPLCGQWIREDPDRVLGHWMRAQLLLLEKDWDALLLATGEALARFPDEETMMFLRGRAFQEKGDRERAAQCYARAIGMKPSYAGARAALGRLHEEQGRLDLAEELFREIPAANPAYAGGAASLALFLGRRGRWDEAETLFLDAWSRMRPAQQARLRAQPDVAPMLARERVRAALAT